ncbi:bifunctional diguanylate cyclase/phosphodiesterase [Massilia timonae]|uniref:Diguanylate cyclase (GGDEF) domain-containing protein n=1 Tax=Massilia timonae CCUG 45783 TaxID=883126 RepID=K9D9Q2_9BURK|nr:EAL domain-containing protein [Massilia timonae]EKU81434.1 diguanylate cyclase (GGDEF) domain-containing protein [Massilia timonae CCUG 45783]
MSKHPGLAPYLAPYLDPARSNRFLVLLWPLLAVLACSALWAATLLRVEAEQERVAGQARKDVAAYAEAYEQYITRSVAQMDQITMQLKFSWENSRQAGLLDEMRRDGMFTDSAFHVVAVLDRGGVVRSSTRAGLIGADLAPSAWFNHHRDNNSTALRVGAAPTQFGSADDVVLFTRRLETREEEFDGVVLMAIDARYFTSFVSPATIGAGGIVALAGSEGRLRVEQRSNGASFTDAVALPRRGAAWSGEQGVRLVEGEGGFADGQSRVLGWRQSTAYPLVALVGLPQHAALEANNGYWIESRDRAIVATLCLLLLGAVGAALARRAVARAREQDEVRRAYRAATESGNDGFYMASAVRARDGQITDFRIVDCNERGAFFYGVTRDELVGSSLTGIDSGLFGEDLLGTYRKAMDSGFHEDDRRMPSDNRLNISWGRRRLVRVGNGLAVTLQDISERKAHEAQLERLANEDSLTGLATRHAFLERMPAMLAQAQEASAGNGASAALLFIDLDEFKHVNDTHGHATGDQLLKAAAGRLLSLLRPGDGVARFGGDEFVVLLSPCDGERQAASVASRIVEAFAVPFLIGDELHAVGSSIGISLYPRDGLDAETLVRHSDIAMYVGKNEGKGQYRFFDPSLSSTLNSRARLKQNMLEALEADQFVLHYQPRVDARSGELLSMEALVRWRHPSLGMVAPGEFIPLAEATGLIVRIGETVIDKACAQLAAWREAGVALVPVSINVSPKQFLRGGVQRQLSAALVKHRVPASLIEVEITESAMMGDQDDILAELAALRALGVKLHVDDFGTGYSSLSQLQRLKMDVLKVDRAFTTELANSKEGKVFFQAIVSMAHALGMSVVAEGVETEEQLAILRHLDCNEVQGYFIARPVPAEEMAAMMERRYLLDAQTAPAV